MRIIKKFMGKDVNKYFITQRNATPEVTKPIDPNHVKTNINPLDDPTTKGSGPTLDSAEPKLLPFALGLGGKTSSLRSIFLAQNFSNHKTATKALYEEERRLPTRTLTNLE
jgi:hypothetical protein